jgi:hypothetical protein
LYDAHVHTLPYYHLHPMTVCHTFIIKLKTDRLKAVV